MRFDIEKIETFTKNDSNSESLSNFKRWKLILCEFLYKFEIEIGMEIYPIAVCGAVTFNIDCGL